MRLSPPTLSVATLPRSFLKGFEMGLLNVIDRLADELPDGYVVKLCVENGSAWVELYDELSTEMILPDSADRTMKEQLIDALTKALED